MRRSEASAPSQMAESPALAWLGKLTRATRVPGGSRSCRTPSTRCDQCAKRSASGFGCLLAIVGDTPYARRLAQCRDAAQRSGAAPPARGIGGAGAAEPLECDDAMRADWQGDGRLVL